MHVTAIIAAGGRGQRFGAAGPKQLLSVGGRPILERSVAAFASHPDVDELVIALPQALVDDPPEYLRSAEAFALRDDRSAQAFGRRDDRSAEASGRRDDRSAEASGRRDDRSAEAFGRRDDRSAEAFALRDDRSAEAFALCGAGKPLRIVAGGDRRQDSVANAFAAVAAASDIIVIHDAARPFASADLIARTIAAAAESGAAVAAVQSRDTVKQGRDRQDGQGGRDGQGRHERFVRSTLPRETIYLAQTPQAFQRDVLRRALEIGARQGVEVTDEAALVELAGLPVRLVDGEASNIKITTPEDMTMGEAIAAGEFAPGTSDLAPRTPHLAPRTGRAGTGYDLHRLVAGRPLILGGVTIPSERGALGHSDADVVCHALTDAILGAAALGDIGAHFPDTDSRWKDADSLDLLRQAVALVADQGLMVGNVDVTVILETPKIRGYVDAMRASLAAALGLDQARVSVKGKTNEGVDAVGRGEAIAAHAVALLRAK